MSPSQNKSSSFQARLKGLRARNIRMAVALWLLFFFCPLPASGQDKALNKPLVASGISPMLGKDSADARSLALEEALRAAVEQGLGYLLPAQNIVRYYPDRKSVV